MALFFWAGLFPGHAGATEGEESASVRNAERAPSPDEAPEVDILLEAERAFQRARDLLAHGQHLEACRQFAQSQALYSSAVTLLNLGNCYESGDLPGGLREAVRAFERALDEANGVSEPNLRERVRDEARRRLQDGRERLPVLILRRSATETAQVMLNGSVVEQFGTALAMNPGRYHLELSAPGKLSQTRDFVLAERRELEIALPALEDAQMMEVGSTPPAPSAKEARQFGNLPLWLGGASAVLGAAWLFTGLTSRSNDAEFSRLYGRCEIQSCDDAALARMAAARSKARDYARVTDYVIIPAFAATLGTGLVLWWLDDFATSNLSSRQRAPETPTPLQAQCSGDGCRWTYTHRF